MPTKCRIIKDFTWQPTLFRGRKGGIVTPPAMLRSLWIKRGFIEVFGEDALAAKEVAAAPVDAPRRAGRPRKVAVS